MRATKASLFILSCMCFAPAASAQEKSLFRFTPGSEVYFREQEDADIQAGRTVTKTLSCREKDTAISATWRALAPSSKVIVIENRRLDVGDRWKLSFMNIGNQEVRVELGVMCFRAAN